MTSEQIRLLFIIGSLAGMVTIVAIFLALLVRYTVLFALLGTAAVIASVTILPKDLTARYSGPVLAWGAGLFILLVLIYQFVQWNRHRKMLAAQKSFWHLGWRSGPQQRRLKQPPRRYPKSHWR